jgi:hypothetical protein
MGAIQDAMALADQQKIDQQAAAANAQPFNPDGSGKVNDFHMPALPQSTFPPNLTAGSELRVNRDQLTTVAANMKTDLAQLEATLQTLYSGGSGGATVGGWDTADGLGNNAGQAYYGISTFYQNLSAVYDQVIGYLGQTVTNYADAESTTATAAGNVGTNAAPGSLGA